MAIVFLPLNGIGLGHLSRAFALAQSLRASGESPVIFSQGAYPEFMADRVPGLSMGTVYKASSEGRQLIASEVQNYARRTQPAVVIEDTHPAPMQLESDIYRLLVVRPTSIEYMRKLQAEHSGAFRRLLIADHVKSPSWPFSAEETAEIEAWPAWNCIGPVFRQGSLEGQKSLRRKYSLQAGVACYVFTMGGGGVQKFGGQDTSAFCERAGEVAEWVRRRDPVSRLLFIRGPLFPSSRVVPPVFEDYAVEDDMPSLLALAAGAVVRPGYNTIWECIAGRTPFIPIEGQTFVEPVVDRLRGLMNAGLLPEDLEQWTDDTWKRQFQSTCDSFVSCWPLSRAVASIRSVITTKSGSPSNVSSSVFAWPKQLPQAHANANGEIMLRIDDVTEENEELSAVLQICAFRGLCVSLDVIPYLCRLRDATLRDLIGDRIQFEVAQHGYAHLPHRTEVGLKAELISAERGEVALRQGLSIMDNFFPTSFRGGFSPPYDYLPSGLSEAWRRVGGRYISVVWRGSNDAGVPVVRLTADPWDWIRGAPQPTEQVVGEVERALRHGRYAGLVLHPQLIRIPGEIHRLETLLDRVLDLGCKPVLISDVARRSEIVASS